MCSCNDGVIAEILFVWLLDIILCQINNCFQILQNLLPLRILLKNVADTCS